MTLKIDTAQRSHVRFRLSTDMGTQAKLLESELEHYGDYFTPRERTLIRDVIDAAKRLNSSCRK